MLQPRQWLANNAMNFAFFFWNLDQGYFLSRDSFVRIVHDEIFPTSHAWSWVASQRHVFFLQQNSRKAIFYPRPAGFFFSKQFSHDT